MSEGTRHVLLSVEDMGVILRSALAAQPELAEKIPNDAVAVVQLTEGEEADQALAGLWNASRRA